MVQTWLQLAVLIMALSITSRTVQAGFLGPFGNIWNDGQCKNIGSFQDKSLDECKSTCEGTPGCTAINFKDSPEAICVLRGCPVPVPPPQLNVTNFQGYSLITVECPSTFTMIGSQCLKVALGSIWEGWTWHQARDQCKQLGANLAQLEDTTDLLDHITSLGKGDWRFWVGAEWVNREKGFRWIKSDKNVSNWEDAKPNNGVLLNNMFIRDEHCVEIQAWNGRYNDEVCKTLRSYVCEYGQ
ncbi:unnamed protein product [Meganyctiphanes norvegica]|uniref:C-type lectin domain-containing protein n=1 Tax=Meganyctiphanes norvegica TaxID=48144 RepID=A0AAV2SNG6_MEGNR